MYEFNFLSEDIAEYFKENVIDTERMSIAECKKKGLPYIDVNGFIKNTKAFMEVNLHYKEHEEYPQFVFGSKEWKDFWIKEKFDKMSEKGVWLGQVRINRYFYFFLNYHSMVTSEDDTTLPSWWLIHFNFFHLLEYFSITGQNFCLIKPRGCGLSECAISLAECDYFIPLLKESGNPQSFKTHQLYASDSSYLNGEGKTFTLGVTAINWINKFGKNHGLYKPPGHTKQESSNNMKYVAGYITAGGKGEKIQTGGSIEAAGIDKPDKAVGGRKSFFLLEECQYAEEKVLMFNGEWKKLKSIVVGDKLMGVDSKPRNVLKVNKGNSKLYTIKEKTRKGLKDLIHVTEEHLNFITHKTANKSYECSIKTKDILKWSERNYNNYYLQKAFTNELIKFRIIDEGLKGDYVGLTLDEDHLYITEKNLVTHNCGTFKILGALLKKLEPNTKRGGKKTGLILAWGTSNADPRGIESFKSLLNNPGLYDFGRFRDVWKDCKKDINKLKELPLYAFEYLIPKNSQEKGVGWFIPYYDSYIMDTDGNSYIDEDGNPLREKAFNKIMETRNFKMLSTTSDNEKNDLNKEFADHPITIQEALMVTSNKRFSSKELTRQLINVETGLVEEKYERGNLHFVKNEQGRILGVKFHKDSRGDFYILEHPEWVGKDDSGNLIMKIDNKLPWKLYLGGIDGIDQGEDDSSTKGSEMGVVIKKRRSKHSGFSDLYANTYVAYYKKRSKTAKVDHQNTLKLLIYFNAEALLEYAKIGLMSYIVDVEKLPKYLANEPSNPRDAIATYKAKKRKKGCRITKEIVQYGNNLIDNYIMESHDKLYSPHILEELSDYTDENKGKYDLIAAMRMCEILCTEYQDKLPVEKTQNNNSNIGKLQWYDNGTGYKVFGIPPTSHIQKQENKQIDYIDHAENKIIYVE